jgi:aspartyl-tRNA(Asn)/glutamyl-tRNA(Gln) amidotransferase subunit A
LRRSGVIFLGKTNVPEFTGEGVTQNPLFGVPRNPWDTDKTPGGSSGGSVAAVALGFSPCSVGTDGGGSVRRPASYTNLVGLKTSIGLIPRGDGLPQLLLDMETIGPITRTVRDQALLLDALAGPDPRDHTSLRHVARPAQEAGFMAALNQPVAPLRILAVGRIGGAPVDPAITERFGEMVALMTTLGHAVTVGPMPFDVQPVYDHWTTIADLGLALLRRNVPEMAEKASNKYVDWARKDYSATHLLEVIEAIGTLRNQAALAFSDTEYPAGGTENTGNTGFDIIMTPSSAAMPWSTDLPFPPEINGVAAGPRGSALFSGWVNACGHPAISLPAPRAASGLPVGVQFTANLGQDALLLQLAQQVEQALPWRDDWPPLATQPARATQQVTV